MGESAYGVTIRAEIAACTDREPAPGALYTTLDRLEEKGLVTSWLGDPTPQRGGRAKRFFTVTASGVHAVARAQRSYPRLQRDWNFRGSSMHSAAIAEWVLSLVAAPDRAASTVGDLVEEVASRGIFWFWSNVLRTAGSHLWHDPTVSPLRMLGLALWGVAAIWVLSLMFGLLISMWLGSFFEYVPAWANPVILVLMCTAWPLLVGWEVGRRSAGRELPSIATLFAAIYVMNLYRASMQGRQIGITWSGMEQYAFAVFCAQALSVNAGAIVFRRRTLAVRKSACYSELEAGPSPSLEVWKPFVHGRPRYRVSWTPEERRCDG